MTNAWNCRNYFIFAMKLPETYKVGRFIKLENGGEFRIMAVAEGYAMCRHKGGIVTAYSLKDVVAFLDSNAKQQKAGLIK